MNPTRKEALSRLKGFDLDLTDACFLHYRSLFSDLRKASAYAHGQLLDIGCGNKPYEKMFASRVSEYIGCDVVQSSESRVDIICPATALAVRDGEFDTVLSTQVIEHVADHRALLSEAFRALKSGGVLILSGPQYWPLHEEPHDYFRFTEHGLRYLLESIGFVQIDIMRNGGNRALCGQALIHAVRNTKYFSAIPNRVINIIFAWLEDRFPLRNNPMNYVVVARKPVKQESGEGDRRQ